MAIREREEVRIPARAKAKSDPASTETAMSRICLIFLKYKASRMAITTKATATDIQVSCLILLALVRAM